MHSPFLFCILAVFSLLFINSITAHAQQESTRLDRAKMLFNRGQNAYSAGNLETALQMFQEAHHLVPSAELAYNIGHIGEQLGQVEIAVRFLRLYLSRQETKTKDHAEVKRRLRRLKRKLINETHPLVSWIEGLKGKALSFFNLGIDLFNQGRYQAALVAFKIALQKETVSDIYKNVALCYKRLGREQDAAKTYRDYLETLK